MKKRGAFFESVKRAAAIGEVQFRFWIKYDRLPKTREELDEFIQEEKEDNNEK